MKVLHLPFNKFLLLLTQIRGSLEVLFGENGHRRSSKRLGYIRGCTKEPKKEDPKYPNRVSENMLVVNWILNSMEESSAGSVIYCDTMDFGTPLRHQMFRKE